MIAADFSASSKVTFGEVARRGDPDLTPDRHIAREADLVDRGVPREQSRLVLLGGEHVDNPWRQSGPLRAPGDHERIQRAFRRGLDDAGAAGGEGRPELVAEDRKGCVPRHDEQRDPLGCL
jgi:hypothetical protein